MSKQSHRGGIELPIDAEIWSSYGWLGCLINDYTNSDWNTALLTLSPIKQIHWL